MTIEDTGIAPTMSADTEDATALDPQVTNPAPTQGIAWCQADDSDAVVAYDEPERRGWHMPITVAFAAIAAIAVAGFLAWPLRPVTSTHPVTQAAPAVPAPIAPPAAAAPARAPTTDDIYVFNIRTKVGIPGTAASIIQMGHDACLALGIGISPDNVARSISLQKDVGIYTAEAAVGAAMEIYCPLDTG